MDELLNPVKELIESTTNDYILNYLHFKSFFGNATSSQNVINVAKANIPNILLLIDLIHNVYPHLKERAMKHKCTKIKNKLLKQLDNPHKGIDLLQTDAKKDSEVFETESDTSQH